MKIQLMTSKRGAVLMLVLGLLLTLTKASSKRELLKKGTAMYLTCGALGKQPAFGGDGRVTVVSDTVVSDTADGVKVSHEHVEGWFTFARKDLQLPQHFETGSTVYLKLPILKENLDLMGCLEVIGDGEQGSVLVKHERLGERTFAGKDLQHFAPGSIVYLTPAFLRNDLLKKHKLNAKGDLQVVSEDVCGEVLVEQEGKPWPIMIFWKDLLSEEEQKLLNKAKELEQKIKNYKPNLSFEKIRNGFIQNRTLKGYVRTLNDTLKTWAAGARKPAGPRNNAPKRRRRLLDRLHTSEKRGHAC